MLQSVTRQASWLIRSLAYVCARRQNGNEDELCFAKGQNLCESGLYVCPEGQLRTVLKIAAKPTVLRGLQFFPEGQY